MRLLPAARPSHALRALESFAMRGRPGRSTNNIASAMPTGSAATAPCDRRHGAFEDCHAQQADCAAVCLRRCGAGTRRCGAARRQRGNWRKNASGMRSLAVKARRSGINPRIWGMTSTRAPWGTSITNRPLASVTTV